jgi:hypothetical protein
LPFGREAGKNFDGGPRLDRHRTGADIFLHFCPNVLGNSYGDKKGIKKGSVRLRSGAVVYRETSPLGCWFTILLAGAGFVIAGIVFVQHIVALAQNGIYASH